MSLSSSMAEIESSAFSARLNVVSGINNFLRALQKEAAIEQVLSEMKSQAVRYLIAQRILELSNREFDTRYEHPSDTALAAYVWLIRMMDPGLLTFIARSASEAPQTWWTKRVLQLNLGRKESRNVAISNVQDSGLNWRIESGHSSSINAGVEKTEVAFLFLPKPTDIFRAQVVSHASNKPLAFHTSGISIDITNLAPLGARNTAEPPQ